MARRKTKSMADKIFPNNKKSRGGLAAAFTAGFGGNKKTRTKRGGFDGSLGKTRKRRGTKSVFDKVSSTSGRRRSRSGQTMGGGLGDALDRGLGKKKRRRTSQGGMARSLGRVVNRKLSPTERNYYNEILEDEISRDDVLSAHAASEDLISTGRGNAFRRLVRQASARIGWVRKNQRM